MNRPYLLRALLDCGYGATLAREITAALDWSRGKGYSLEEAITIFQRVHDPELPLELPRSNNPWRL